MGNTLIWLIDRFTSGAEQAILMDGLLFHLHPMNVALQTFQ